MPVHWNRRRQIFRIMKLTVMLCVCCFCTLSANVMSQERLSMKLGEVPVKQVFEEIRRQTERIVICNDDRLDQYNRAAWQILEKEDLYEVGNPEDPADDPPLLHRKGEAFLIPNLWISGDASPQDSTDTQITSGQPDLLRRVFPGSYILEELEAPEGYAKAFPAAVHMEEQEKTLALL